MRGLYEVLGVQAGAADEEIKAAFRRLAKQLHPDLNPGSAEAERQLQEVTRAYVTLSRKPSRSAYDAGLARQRSLARWRFRAKAMTAVIVFMMALTVASFWGDLRNAFQSADRHPVQVAGNATPLRAVPEETVERSDTVARVEAQAEPSPVTAPDGSVGEELRTGSMAQPTPPVEASGPQPLPPTELAKGGDDGLVSPDVSPVITSKTDGWAAIRDAEIGEMFKVRSRRHPHVVFLCGEDGDNSRLPPHRRLWCSWPALHTQPPSQRGLVGKSH